MLVEFIGCTGSGKSTLGAAVVRELARRGAQATSACELILESVRLNRITNVVARRALINLLAFGYLMRDVGAYWQFCAFAAEVLKRDADTPLLWPLLYRNVTKRLGIYGAVRRNETIEQVVVLDEGTLHIAHNLFVHTSSLPDLGDVALFIDLVPMPDVVVFVRAPVDFCVECTLARGHRRIQTKSRIEVEKFVNQAHWVFEHLVTMERVQDNLLIMENVDPSVETTRAVVKSTVDSIMEMHSSLTSTQ